MILAFVFGAFFLVALGAFGYIRYKRSASQKRGLYPFAAKQTSTQYSIRQADVNDIECIRNLALEIWPKTYSKIFSPRQVIYMLNKWFSEASLQRQMANGNQFILIHAGQQLIGFASYSEVLPAIYNLHRIYILPAFQGLGAGKFTMGIIVDELKAKKATSLTLNINKHNPAKAFYEQLGFKVAKTEFSEVGNGYIVNDYVMELKISNQTSAAVNKRNVQSL